MPQSSLFSFFSAKAAKPASSIPSATSSKPGASSKPPVPVKKEVKTAPQSPPLPSLGERVEIYFPDDAEYFACDVTESVKGSKFRVEYDDGNKEVVDFGEAEWKVCKTKKARKAKKPQSAASNADADDDENEFSDAMEEEDSEDDFKGDESSESEDDIDDWMVDDDASEADADVFDEDSEDDSGSPKKRRLGKAKDKGFSSKKKAKKAPVNMNSKVSFSPDYEPSPKTPGSTSSKLNNPLSQFKLTEIVSTPSAPSAPLAVTPAAGRAPSPAPTSSKDQLIKWVDGEVNPMGSHVHNHLPFLWKENLMDAQGVRFGQPGYNKRTLKWTPQAIEKVMGGKSKITAAKQQWWEIKAQYFDTVLLFKTGKFYEMFHMDSDIAVKVLGFSHMKGGEAHAGSPEAAYGTVCAKLVAAGYKVARVEQTETPAQLKIRKDKTPKGKKKPSVVNREVCAVTTVGTRTFCFLDSDRCFDKDSKFGSEADKGPLLVVKEIMMESSAAENIIPDDDTPPAICEYGVTMVDAVRGTITLGQFADDKLRSRLHTLLTSTCPSEVIVEPTCSADLRTMITQSCGGAPVETVSSSECLPKSTAVDPAIRAQLDRKDGFNPWDHSDCVSQIKRKKYFLSSSKSEEKEESIGRWPKVVKACVDGGANLALGSMGAAIFYLQRSLVDFEIISMAEVRAYVPPMTTNARVETSENVEGNNTMSQMSEELFTELDGVKETTTETNVTTDHMQLDGITLENLEILANQTDGKAKGSLWSKINRTKTPHGSRLLRGWLLRPLFKSEDIARRADAVSELASGPPALMMAEASPLMRKVGDVERLLSRIHSMGGGEGAHPSNRQVLYEGKTHTKRKVKDFNNLIKGLQFLDKVINLFADADIKSTLLKKLVKRQEAGGIFPSTTEKLKWFANNFDARKAEEGKFSPVQGMDEEYDEAVEAKDACLQQLYALEAQYCNEIPGAKGKFKYINIKDDSKDKFMIELPVNVRVPSDFKVKGKKGSGAKQVNKYYTVDVEEVVERLNEAIDQEVEGRARGLAAIFRKFDSFRPLWSIAVQVSGMLDALSALSEVSSQPGWSRATILESKGPGTSSVDIKGGRHPCVEVTHSGDDFVPNDLALGGEEKERVLLLSGPNMGGKSTLLRQTCLISILAQIGCFVPAQSAAITPMDRIFTRLGASDKILAGQSTFFVELSETAAALRGATHRSIVIMDELGRGTSTFDGTALAHAVVKSLVEDTKCLTMFATHYHSLLEDWKEEPNVRLGHMKCHVTDGDEKNITFLYQLGEGACPKSFGINVARLAGLPEGVLAIAEKRSANFQKEMEGGVEGVEAVVEKIKKAAEEGNVAELRSIWESLNA
ncbi:hypothetical protein TL16_g07839 [Triparma laevis f. inornata]|uniref:DNA mismatch repair protein n=1 Tax=Triparma laevis f. inornata TaxID=1714386 RepID=A0A9W7B0V6_9STRA|nr:hypothetical protein TL16_g07839 [Triparma laevis f. inornata]